jgi:hypothetical protein
MVSRTRLRAVLILWATISKTHGFTDAHTCGVSVAANAVAAIPTTRAPTYAPDGAPPVAATVGRANALRRPLIGCGLRGHGGFAQPRQWRAPLTVDGVPHVQAARCQLR